MPQLDVLVDSDAVIARPAGNMDYMFIEGTARVRRITLTITCDYLCFK